MKRSLPWILGLLLIAVAVVAAFLRQPPVKNTEFDQPGGSRDVTVVEVVARNRPVVVRFEGDLAEGGKFGLVRTNGIIPFVIGDSIKLDAEVQNTVMYRWSVNGKTLDNEEWSLTKSREYTVEHAGELKVELQVRGSDPRQVSQPKVIVLKTMALVVESFEPQIIHDENDDHLLTGSDYSVVVDMLDPVDTPMNFYKFRYLVNDQPIRNPDDEEEGDTDGEWCYEKEFTYTFPAPGHYTFKVEVRRPTSDKVEATKELGLVLVVADAVLSSFDASPEKNAPLGTDVDLTVWNESNCKSSDVRFGVRKLTAAEFEWIPIPEGEENAGAYWSELSARTWKPREPGNYLLRAEVREVGKEKADDFREIQFTITDGDI